MMSSSFSHFSECFPCSCFSMCMHSYSTFCSILSALNGHSVSFSRCLFVIDPWCWISMLCSSLYNYYIFLSILFWVVNSPGRMPYVEQGFSLTVSLATDFSVSSFGWLLWVCLFLVTIILSALIWFRFMF